MMSISCRLTAPFSGRPQTLQHAGAQDLFEHNLSSPAAKHFINPGPLQRFVRRPHSASLSEVRPSSIRRRTPVTNPASKMTSCSYCPDSDTA